MLIKVNEHQAYNVKCNLRIYACPKILCSPTEWSLSQIFNEKIELNWTTQNLLPNHFSADLNWISKLDIAPKIVSSLATWSKLRFEVIQTPSNDVVGQRFSVTPELGIFRADTNSLGETLLTESRISSAILRTLQENTSIEQELDFMLGKPWDNDLEPFRNNQLDSCVKWITKTG